MIFGSMPRGPLAGKDCFHARLLRLAMFGKPRSAAVSKVRTSSGSRQDAVGLTMLCFYAQISQSQKHEVVRYFFVFSRGRPKWLESNVFVGFSVFQLFCNIWLSPGPRPIIMLRRGRTGKVAISSCSCKPRFSR